MALVTTTLSNALAQGDKEAVVASATSIAVGRLVIVDQEVCEVSKEWSSGTTIPLLRGRNGTAQLAHPATANFSHGDPSDFGDPGAGTFVNYPPAGRSRKLTSYSASGAISLPAKGTDEIAVLNGTSVLVMTLADPDQESNGSMLTIVANGAAAHTLTNTTGFGGAGSSYDVLTFDGTGTAGLTLVACNAVWVLLNQVDGTLTNIATSIA